MSQEVEVAERSERFWISKQLFLVYTYAVHSFYCQWELYVWIWVDNGCLLPLFFSVLCVLVFSSLCMCAGSDSCTHLVGVKSSKALKAFEWFLKRISVTDIINLYCLVHQRWQTACSLSNNHKGIRVFSYSRLSKHEKVTHCHCFWESLLHLLHSPDPFSRCRVWDCLN